MRRKEYACPNGCSLPPRRKQLREYNDGTYGFDFYDFTFCPCCGSLMPYSLKKLKGFFEVYNIHAALSDAVQLIYKSEFESAAREAFVAVENYLKKKSGLDSHGFDLATRALSFEIDKQTGEIKRAPLIAINDLKNESQRNEQDGIRYTSAIQAGAPLLNIGIGYFDYRNKISPAKADGGFSYIIKANRDGIIHI